MCECNPQFLGVGLVCRYGVRDHALIGNYNRRPRGRFSAILRAASTCFIVFGLSSLKRFSRWLSAMARTCPVRITESFGESILRRDNLHIAGVKLGNVRSIGQRTDHDHRAVVVDRIPRDDNHWARVCTGGLLVWQLVSIVP